MRTLIFTTDTEEYRVDNGDMFMDGIVKLDGHEVFRSLILDREHADEEIIRKFANSLRQLERLDHFEHPHLD